MKRPDFKPIIVVLLFMVFTSTACGLTDFFNRETGDVPFDLEAQVNATLTAIASEKDMPVTETPTVQLPSETPTQEINVMTGVITGELFYPGEFLPPLRVVAFDASDEDRYFVTEIYTGDTFSLEVTPGTYIVVAFLIEPYEAGAPPNLSGAYSQAVLCGLAVGCDDHSLVLVDVSPGETVAGIDPADWYMTADHSSVWPSDPVVGETGAISGNLGYPSEFIPPLRVVAFNVHTADYAYVDTLYNQATYEITDLPPGTYHVVAYVSDDGPDWPAGYSRFVTCGMTVDCENHDLVDVFVYAGEVTSGVDPIDFYAQPDEIDWPENPTE